MSVTAQLADGRTLEFPDGTDPSVVQATVKKMLAPTTVKDTTPQALSWLEKAALTFSGTGAGKAFDQIPDVYRTVQGAADAPIGAAQLLTHLPQNQLANAIGPDMAAKMDKFVQDREKEIKSRRGGDDSFDWQRALGNMIGPANLLAGAPATATTLGRIGQGAAIGAASGATNPVAEDDFAAEKAKQIALGGTLGAVLPASWEGTKAVGKTVRNVVDPSLPGGLERAAGRMANVNAGTKRDEIIKLLEDAQSAVPGAPITAGQASVPANRAEFAAFQELAKNANPSLYAGDKGVEGVQEAARRAAIQDFAKTPADLAAAEGTRAGNALQNYGQAYATAVKADPELAKIASNPYFQKALPTALDLAKAKGINPKTDMTEFLQQVKIGIDKQLAPNADTALSRAEQSAALDAKQQLVDWLGKKNPLYDQARTAFAADSKPINEMQVGQFLQNKLDAPLGTAERAASFAQAVRDAPGTLKRSTGNNVASELSDVLQPESLAAVKNVLTDLQNNAAYKDLAKSGMTAATKNVGVTMPEMPATGAFNPKLSVARALANRIIGKESGKVLETAGTLMTDPKNFAQVMKNATPFERQKIVDELMKLQAAGMGQQP